MRYFLLTLKHKWFVLLASFRVGLPLWLVLIHDLSKFTPEELPHYNRRFCSGTKESGGEDPAGFAVAWLHHQNRNKHHWEYWITRKEHGNTGAMDGCLPMPKIYVKEMVVDWLAASKAYGGSWDVSEWLDKNISRIRLHDETRKLLKIELLRLGYVI